MVAQSINETDKEIITEVYQVYKDKELRLDRFGVWDPEEGLKGPPYGLYLRRNDLFGHNLRVASLQVRSIILFPAKKFYLIIIINNQIKLIIKKTILIIFKLIMSDIIKLK